LSLQRKLRREIFNFTWIKNLRPLDLTVTGTFIDKL
jgi:hypothetical protein